MLKKHGSADESFDRAGTQVGETCNANAAVNKNVAVDVFIQI